MSILIVDWFLGELGAAALHLAVNALKMPPIAASLERCRLIRPGPARVVFDILVQTIESALIMEADINVDIGVFVDFALCYRPVYNDLFDFWNASFF